MKDVKIKQKVMYSKLDKSRFLFCYLCVLFPVAQFLIFYVFINFNSIVLAFQNDFGQFDLKNFGLVMKAVTGEFSPVMGVGSLGRAIEHSVILWLWTKLFVFPISLVSTYILFKRVPGHYAFRLIFMIPAIIGATVWIATLQDIADYNGIIVEICKLLNIKLDIKVLSSGFLFNPDTSFNTMVIFTVFGVVGGDVVLTGAMSRVPGEIFESAKIDGAGFWHECVQIAIPCVGPTISTILTFSLCSFFVADCNAFLYTRGAAGEFNAETMGFYFLKLQMAVKEGGSGYTYPAAVGMVITLITVPFVLLGRWVLEKLFPPIEF